LGFSNGDRNPDHFTKLKVKVGFGAYDKHEAEREYLPSLLVMITNNIPLCRAAA
jgi:hypothetical protein